MSEQHPAPAIFAAASLDGGVNAVGSGTAIGVAGSVNIQHTTVIAASDTTGSIVDEVAAVEATVGRHRRRNRLARPRIMAAHPGVSILVDRLSSLEAPRVLVVHGRAGSGKTTVVVDAVECLLSAGWMAGVVRMDAVEQVSHSARVLGRTFELSDSPVVALASVATGAPSVLVVDQLDAVSLYSGRMPDSYDAVAEMLEQAEVHPNMKVVLVVRTVDLQNDPRMCSLLADENSVESVEVDDLSAGALRQALTEAGIEATSLDSSTLDLLRVPLHLAVFSRLSADSRAVTYRTLPDLYEQFTKQVRLATTDDVAGPDWQRTINALVTYMSDNESLQAPAAVLDGVPPRVVSALVSVGVLIEDVASVAFFHETYFDFHFARAFVAGGRDLHDFLVESGQHLFRRAQTRQVLEHLAGIAPRRFREVVMRLLSSDAVRVHLLDVVISVLGNHDATAEDWLALEPLAFGGSRRGAKLVGLLSLRQWFDAADAAHRWEALLTDATTSDASAHQLIVAARHHPQRVAQLIHPRIGASEKWNQRLRAIVEWSLTPGLVDFTVELIESGLLDDARGPIAVNSDFWSIVHGIKDEDPTGAARIIGAYLHRAWVRAQAEGSSDPFASKHIDRSTSGGESTISEVAKAAPEQFLSAVLPFIIDVLEATSTSDDPDGLRRERLWSYRYLDSHQIHSAIFAGVESSLVTTAPRLLASGDALIRTLAASDLEPLRFLACRAYTAITDQAANEAVDWLLSDQRNFHLGWSDSSAWASRQLVEAAARHCDDARLTALADQLVDYYPAWETRAENRRARGHRQYVLLSAIPPERLTAAPARRLQELRRKFAQYPPTPPRQTHVQPARSPVPDKAAEFMTDNDWRRAIAKYHSERTHRHHEEFIGGVHQLAGMLGRRAELEPDRFTRLAMTFDENTHPAHIDRLIDAVTGKITISMLTRLCVHARTIADAGAGRAICRAIGNVANEVTKPMIDLLEHYTQAADPENEAARTPGHSEQVSSGGNLESAEMNCTRGLAAAAIGQVLFTYPEYAVRLLPIVSELAGDPILTVRTQATIPILVLLKTHPNEALDLADTLFGTAEPTIFDSDHAMRLLVNAMCRAPERFAPYLTRCLTSSDAIAERAGQIWAVALINKHLGTSTPTDPTTFTTAARKGATTVLANTPDANPELLKIFFNDENPDVREAASTAIRHLDQIDSTTAHDLVSSFTTSTAFTEHFETLFHSLEHSLRLLPNTVITASARAIDIASSDLGNIRTARAASSRDIVAVVLRLYRQGDQHIRSKCLDLIDRMSDVGAYGLTEALLQER